MNKEAILQLADLIEASGKAGDKAKIRYNQGNFGTPEQIREAKTQHPEKEKNWCGTACCIAGFWAARSGNKAEWLSYFEADPYFDLSRVVKELDLTVKQAVALFDGREKAIRGGWGAATPTWQEAVKVLRHLAETGKVKWPRGYARTGGVVEYDVLYGC